MSTGEGNARTLYTREVKSAIEEAIHRLITQTGGDPLLAAALPDWLYTAAYPRHAPLTAPGGVQDVRHAQMFGYVPSAQYSLPLGVTTQTLLQLPSDPGLDMIIGDMGELDFQIEPDALSQQDWERVRPRHLGH